MAVSFDFSPNAQRAATLDKGMHKDLGASLEHVIDQCRGQLAFDEMAAMGLVKRLKMGMRHPPVAFALYYELVDALIEERWEDASANFAELTAIMPLSQRFRVNALGEAALKPNETRYVRLMCSDQGLDINFLPPQAERAEAFKQRLAAGMELIDRGAPRLAAEVRNIVDEVVLVAGDPTKKMQFDGGSHFQLWGALFLNTDFHPTPIAVAEVVAHESAHSLLFGFCRDENLVENDESELFSSPLRLDPRPMNGIYHATFVSARMHSAMETLIQSGLLSEAERDFAVKARDADLKNFAMGYSVVRDHGRLTPVGMRLMRGAKAYMDAAGLEAVA